MIQEQHIDVIVCNDLTFCILFSIPYHIEVSQYWRKAGCKVVYLSLAMVEINKFNGLMQ